MELEPDQRHGELIVKYSGLDRKAKAVTSPGERRAFEDREEHPELDRSESKRYRAIIARANYMSTERSDVQYSVKELSRFMAIPRTCDWTNVKRLARYLLGKPRTVLVYGYQQSQQFLETWTDTDFAGCRSERKSTSGGLVMHGSHCLKSWSSTQSIIAGSTGEAEYYGLVKGGSNSLGMRALMEDLGVSVKLRLKSDASAAIGIASRRGLGKIRHLEVSQLWLQQKVANGDLELIKVNGGDNLADALTKHLGAGDLQKHMIGVGLEERGGRHDIMPEVAQDGEEEYAVQMVPGEDEDGHTLEAIQFGNGKEKGLEPPRTFAGKWEHCRFPGIVS